MSFDRPEIYSAPVLQGESPNDDDNTEIIKSFKNFILEFRLDSQFIYRDQLRNNILVKNYSLTVNMEHLIGYNEDIYKKLSDEPSDIIPLFETAITQVAKRISILSRAQSANNNDKDPENTSMDTDSLLLNSLPTFQLILNSNANQIPLRDLDSEHVSKIVRLSGIIISTSVLSSRATYLSIMCRNCRHTTSITINNFNSITGNTVSLPRSCLSTIESESSMANESNIGDESTKKNCGPDPYIIIHESSKFIDQQFLKLQEIPELVPVGEMPRNLTMTCDRYLTNKVIPGTRVTIVGIYSIYNSKNGAGSGRSGGGNGGSGVAIRTPYIKILGIQSDVETSSIWNSVTMFTEEEEEEFLQLSRNPKLYEILTNSIAPSIFGIEDIKKAIVCLLMGGSKKILPDGMRLRGDINVLLLGDPGTAKSQLLKFVEKVSPIAVYTSGKGSSAAGLTASVQRDPMTREFYLEGGAMVLADGGVVCIDEFDKMRDEDRVAIHEAMEQQTISIAKAGITTVLNSRTSVLAAANPIYGRYDDLKSPGDNIDFQTTILSRFDMIFIVKDDHNEERDISIANHVINIHTGNANAMQNQQEENGSEISIEKMKRYITYCRLKCAPRLSPQAAEKLSSNFVTIRKQLLINELESTERSSIPITIRQLEAIIRITESLAKLELSPIAQERHVDEAIRLFQASTMDAASQDPIGGLNQASGTSLSEIRRFEQELKRRLPIGWSTSYQTLRREFVDTHRFSQLALDKALYALEKHETIQLRHQGQNIYRSGV
ncbi:Mcm5p [Saccharomyces cerevisiae YJM1388]|nr:Mcm5p [Saccharomyces cerevisiae YJM1388]CAI4642934.1 ALH_1c_G0037640.mRNA.1.CDS.1 [Saccharomyces cerevisiae]CAI4664780.1 ALH_1b_G0037820.mRNA.1.CDS.1 [Saccharomyces cerevisiae]CAI5297022.1 AKR_HP2_G0036210.mRNA.1.CDS.1 [Saccharomyces cerevisiae]CAI6620486.1 AKR_HP2_G0036210.mRNA.1.CDS.1 [Saccharomyces cerevisiae]